MKVHATQLQIDTVIIDPIVERALEEDLGQGDVTVDFLPALADGRTEALIRTRQRCVVSGLAVAARVFYQVDHNLAFIPKTRDGETLAAGETLALIQGCTASVLKAERTALNFLQHLSGIATETRRYVDAIAGTGAQITHTRKTTPGLRALERQAVVHGGGALHRYNLGSAAMLKDNHLVHLSIEEAVSTLRQRVGHTVAIEVETESLTQVQAALEAKADIIMLDNMSVEEVKQAVALIGGQAKIEASGNLSLETVRAYAETGAQFLSTSKITLGTPAIDIGLDILEA